MLTSGIFVPLLAIGLQKHIGVLAHDHILKVCYKTACVNFTVFSN